MTGNRLGQTNRTVQMSDGTGLPSVQSNQLELDNYTPKLRLFT